MEGKKKRRREFPSFLKEKGGIELWLHYWMLAWLPRGLRKARLGETTVLQAERRERRIMCHTGVCSTTMALYLILINKTSLTQSYYVIF